MANKYQNYFSILLGSSSLRVMRRQEHRIEKFVFCRPSSRYIFPPLCYGKTLELTALILIIKRDW